MSFYRFLVIILDLFSLITSMTIAFLMDHQVNLFDNPFHLNYIKICEFMNYITIYDFIIIYLFENICYIRLIYFTYNIIKI